MGISLQSFNIPHFPSLIIAMSKPAHLVLVEYSPAKPAIIFCVISMSMLPAADDILTHCDAGDDDNRYPNIYEADLQAHLHHVADNGLAETEAFYRSLP